MGANQSNAEADGGEAEIKTSYYELLGVERQATEDEIKKAYRRKALELHPDRNYGKEDEATRLFADIQTAYEVLSDPQERSWYDSHESAILRGGADGEEHFEQGVRFTSADDITAMMAKFNGRVDYSDSPNGFFGFLREKFEQISKEEHLAADWEGAEVPDYPLFGHKDDTYEDVVKDFYTAWTAFYTKKSFAWKDKYRMLDAPDRRYRRAMEKENKKLRDEGVREFNDAVRTLVAFVRKRDPRYTPNTQTDAQRQEVLQEARKAQAAKARAANAAKVTEDAVPEWARAREQEELEESDEEEIDEEQFECVACNKLFKSEKQFDAHEKSKKHQKAVHALKKKMAKDGQRLGLNEEDMSSNGAVTPAEDADEKDEMNSPIPHVDGLSLDNADSQTDDISDPAPKTEDKPPTPEQRRSEQSEDEDGSTHDYGPGDHIAARLNSQPSLGSEASTEQEPEDQPASAKKIGKAAQKRARKAAKAASTDTEDLRFKCAKCNAAFPSRTQLFQHIKTFGHAALKSETGKSGRGKGK